MGNRAPRRSSCQAACCLPGPSTSGANRGKKLSCGGPSTRGHLPSQLLKAEGLRSRSFLPTQGRLLPRGHATACRICRSSRDRICDSPHPQTAECRHAESCSLCASAKLALSISLIIVINHNCTVRCTVLYSSIQVAVCERDLSGKLLSTYLPFCHSPIG